VTDEALMQAVRDGEVARLGVLFERYHAALFDYLSRVTGNRVAAEDLVQDVFVRVLKYRATWRGDGSFETWIYRMARNARADYFRRRPPLDPLEGAALERPEPSPGPLVRLEAHRDRERLRQALLRLRDDRRELIVLARYRGLAHERIADILGIEVGAVKVRLHRAMRELRDVYLQLSTGNDTWNAKTSTHGSRIT
jgi:RNA polymerase sigma-70 factor (ECF subfamily)